MTTTEPNSILLSAIVPALNEGENVARVVERSIATLDAGPLAGRYELILVDDGSTDDTGRIADEQAAKYPERVQVVHHPRNRGLGAAQISGLAKARGECVTLIPADGEVGIDQAARLFQEMGDADLMVSERKASTAELQNQVRPLFREILSQGNRAVVKFILGFDLTGMEGIYVVRRAVASKFPLRCQTGYFIAELILRCKRAGCTMRRGVMYVSPRISGHSKVTNLRTILRSLVDVTKLRWTLIREG